MDADEPMSAPYARWREEMAGGCRSVVAPVVGPALSPDAEALVAALAGAYARALVTGEGGVEVRMGPQGVEVGVLDSRSLGVW